MAKYDPSVPLISIHLPKCGGSSVGRILRGWFGDKFFPHYANERENEPPRKHILSAGCCVHGHFNRDRGFGVDQYYPEASQFITFLREPTDMMISNYFFAKRRIPEGKNFRDSKKFVFDFDDVNDYLERCKCFTPSFFPEDFNLSNFIDTLSEQFVFVGLAEDLKESCTRLAAILNKPVVEVPLVNASKRDEVVSDNARRRFRERNQLAFELYEYVWTVNNGPRWLRASPNAYRSRTVRKIVGNFIRRAGTTSGGLGDNQKGQVR